MPTPIGVTSCSSCSSPSCGRDNCRSGRTPTSRLVTCGAATSTRRWRRTRVGVVLLTPDLLASDFIADVELPHLLRAARAGDVTLVVVPIEPHVEGSTRFADGDLKDFQWPWTPEEPIAELDARRRHPRLGHRRQSHRGLREPRAARRASPQPVLVTTDRLGFMYRLAQSPPNYTRVRRA